MVFYNLGFFFPSFLFSYLSVSQNLDKILSQCFHRKYINLLSFFCSFHLLSIVNTSCLQGEDSSTCGTGHVKVFLSSNSDLENPGDDFLKREM